MKFSVMMTILIPMMVMWPEIKFHKSKMADGRHLENRFSAIPAPYCPINAIFGGIKQNRSQTRVRFDPM